ncbi:MAG: hypothetical protein J3Q66DRAFT_322498 [Benniella sp.]|nr:MAG: hypothetical protein J3Q66DRAFT_322498 [Benniella sp.]
MDKNKRKHDLVGSFTSIDHLAREQPCPKKKRTYSLRRPRLSSTHSNSSTTSALPPSLPVTGCNESNHVNLATVPAQSESTALITSHSTFTSIQVSSVTTLGRQQDSQQDTRWTRSTKSSKVDEVSTKDSPITPSTLNTEDSKKCQLQENGRPEMDTSIVPSSTEATHRNLSSIPVKHGEEVMQETTQADDHIDGVYACSATLEHMQHDTLGCTNDQSYVQGPNMIDKDDEFLDDEIQDWDLDDFDEECEQSSAQEPVPENACPICGIDLLNLDTMTPDAHVNRCLDGTIGNSTSTVPEHPIGEQTIQGNPLSSIIGTIRSAITKFPSYSKSTNGPSSSKPSTKTPPKARPPRPCPFYKKMPDTSFTVDAFCYGAIEGCNAYFLSHFHSDHYGGLTSTWNHGPIYCSSITANLVVSRLGVDPTYVKRLPMYEPTVIHDVTVRLMDANHCPGSVLFVFDLQTPRRRYLHTGDFRASPDMCLDPILRQPPNVPIDILYLDTTYSNPRYTFPPQDIVIQEAANLVCREVGVQHEQVTPTPVVQVVAKKVNLMESWLKRESGNREKLQSMSIKATQNIKGKQTWQEPAEKSKIVICVGTYLIGKERVFMAIAKAIKSKVFVKDAKLQILACLEDPELNDMLTSDRHEAQVHLLHMGSEMSPESLQEYLDSLGSTFTRLIAIRPTGWTFTGSKKFTPADSGSTDEAIAPTPMTLEIKPSFTSSTIKIYPIPYSEHSSFNELAGFVRSLDIRKVIPTVGVGSEKGRHSMNEWFRRWEEERRQGKGWE